MPRGISKRQLEHLVHSFSLMLQMYISAGKGLIKKVTEQIVYLAFSMHVDLCLIFCDLHVQCMNRHLKKLHYLYRTLSD